MKERETAYTVLKSIRKIQKAVGLDMKGEMDDIRMFFLRYPQGSQPYSYLLSGGWAIEIITGIHRPHDDINIVLLEKSFNQLFIPVDKSYPDPYWGSLHLTRNLLMHTAYDVYSDICGARIACVHPSILLLQKINENTLHTPWLKNQPIRQKDVDDIHTLLRFWHTDPTKDLWENTMNRVIGIQNNNFSNTLLLRMQTFGIDSPQLVSFLQRDRTR